MLGSFGAFIGRAEEDQFFVHTNMQCSGVTNQWWLPGKPVSSRYQRSLPSDLTLGVYDRAIGLFDLTGGKERPVEFALKASVRDPKGYYNLTRVTVNSAATVEPGKSR